MKICNADSASVAMFAKCTLVFTFAALAVMPTNADDATNQSSRSSESKSVPLWRRGISTWNGSGYTIFPNGNGFPSGIKTPTDIGGAHQNDGGAIQVHLETTPESPKSYSVPIDPSIRHDVPSVQVNPFALRDLNAAADHIGLSLNSPPTVSTLPANQPAAKTAKLQTGLDNASAPTATKSQSLPEAIVDNATADISPTITEQLKAGFATEQPPLLDEAIRWYQYPWRWMRTGWTNHAEFGLDGSNGNSDTLAIQTGIETKRNTDNDTLALDFDYRFAKNQNVTTQENGRLNLDYDRLIGDSSWSYFGKFGMEWDTFKAFDLRLNLNGGLGYHWIRNDRTTFVNRFGAGASKEIGAPDDDWKAEAVFGLDGEHRINKYHKVKGKADYFPAWEDFSDYRLVIDLAWEILLDDEDNLSLKLAATDRYDSTPQGAEPNDLYYSLLLLVKF